MGEGCHPLFPLECPMFSKLLVLWFPVLVYVLTEALQRLSARVEALPPATKKLVVLAVAATLQSVALAMNHSLPTSLADLGADSVALILNWLIALGTHALLKRAPEPEAAPAETTTVAGWGSWSYTPGPTYTVPSGDVTLTTTATAPAGDESGVAKPLPESTIDP